MEYYLLGRTPASKSPVTAPLRVLETHCADGHGNPRQSEAIRRKSYRAARAGFHALMCDRERSVTGGSGGFWSRARPLIRATVLLVAGRGIPSVEPPCRGRHRGRA